ncbi:helix-turn-helix transcriptional regulator [Lactiplantibacillus plantarum]|uniref:HTH cro/C1-type domain-containing protein n=1 Tax=Lactiplantibacillus plantarum subsp. plantarum TaxID=337330 RepID=A0A2S3U2U6_LACPN|nr:helix-turn-helix transcriptional regulator [Lactiplantibacillus plantarum]POD82364.1 hypothetical protein S101258_02594 [Lactiplantibacillus plantarum subsp. plantarum]ANI95824.1 hypothetical protein A9F05_09675 [Lactiplantibacillus plantarum]AYG27295.1 XRE family transcriptional regulator [Lactiplantibacillus plantarum]MBY8573133.1 helix-turn-helix transcriptional regulator [Lactiplantibacillus plantarum]MCB7139948.1 helix-turn-helix transcriptional regulator [Lactiplantibacillus plantarum
MSDTAKIIGENIRLWMAIKQHNVTEIAKDAGISRTTVIKLRNGNSNAAQLNTLEKIASYFNVTVADLVTKHHLGLD